MEISMQVTAKKQLILTDELCKQLELEAGNVLQLFEVDGVMLLEKTKPSLSQLAQSIRQARLEAGVSEEEMLAGLQKERQRIFEERYRELLDDCPEKNHRRDVESAEV